MRKPDRNSLLRQNVVLGLAVLLITVLPLLLVRGEYGGSDGQAEAAIQTSHPGYRPWFKPLLEPASAEIESLLFSAQAAFGAGIIGYVIGFYRGRSHASTRSRQSDDQTSE